MNNTDKKLLMECITFEADPRMLRESTAHPNQPFTVQGVLQRKGKKNQNGRIYPDEILIREATSMLRRSLPTTGLWASWTTPNLRW